MEFVLCQSFRNQGFSYNTLAEQARNDHGSVNPSEIKGSVTHFAVLMLIATMFCVNPSEIKGSVTQLLKVLQTIAENVSILQKSRVQLHMKKQNLFASLFCVNPSEIKGSVTPNGLFGQIDVPGVSILQKSRVQLHWKLIVGSG